MTRVRVRAAFIERAAPANPCKHERKILLRRPESETEVGVRNPEWIPEQRGPTLCARETTICETNQIGFTNNQQKFQVQPKSRLDYLPPTLHLSGAMPLVAIRCCMDSKYWRYCHNILSIRSLEPSHACVRCRPREGL